MSAFWGRSVLPAFAAIVSAAGCTPSPQHAAAAPAGAADSAPPAGFRALFNGKDLTGWKADAQAKRHWTVQGGVLDYDGQDRDLWTQEEFGDFVLTLEWRWSGRPVERDHPLIGPDGYEVKGPDGKVATRRVPDGGDSGIFLRGFRKAQVNLFCYPVGSGEVWEYRTDPKMTAKVRRAVTPKKQADKPIGEWNRITVSMKGDRLTVVLNGEEVITDAQLPGVPARGAIGLQHEHGTVQFRNIAIKELGVQDRPAPSGEPLANRLRLPEGFTVERVAGEPQVRFPMFAAFDDRGRLFVAESSGLDLYAEITALTRRCRISVLEDRDGDGTFETSQVFADKLVFPMGLDWRDGKLYVADPPDLVAYEDTDGDGRADRRTVLLSGFGHRDNGSLHGLVFGPDGRLFMTMGEPDGYKLKRRDGTFLEGRSGALIRCRPDGADPEVLCRGFVNLVEVAFTPRGDAFGTDNWFQRPSGGFRDALVHLVDGGLYPYVADVGTPYPVTGEPLPATAQFPAVALSGLTCYRGPSFPAGMRGHLFSAQHNARAVGRHELVAEGATFRTRDFDFVTTDDPDFHPSDVLEDADGSLLVIDTGSWYVHHCPTGKIRKAEATGGVYRVRRVGAPRVEDPWGLKLDLGHAAPDRLAALLGDARPAVRDRARRALAALARGAVAALTATLEGRGDVGAKLEAVWSLAALADDAALAPLRQALADAQEDVVIAAARALALREDRRCAPALVRLLSASSPAVRRAAAEALARCGDGTAVPALWVALTEQPDRFLEHALVHTAYRLADDPALEAALAHAHPRAQMAALLLLDQPPRPTGRLGHEPVLRRVRAADADLRQAALRILERHPEWAEHAVGLLRGWLDQPQLTAEEEAGLRGLVAAFQERRPVQELVGAAIGNRGGRTTADRRRLLLGAVAECTLRELPAAWVDALAHALGDADPAVRMQALRTAAVLQVPRLDERLARLAEDAGEPAEVRLEALRAVILRRPKLSDRAFDLLLGRLGETEAPLTRLAAAEVLGRCRLDDDRLARFLAVLRADPLISPPVVLPALTGSATAVTAPALLRYLEGSVRAGWRPTEAALAEVLQALPAAVRGEAGPLRDLVRQGTQAQAARLAEFAPLLDGGDAGRGRAVFFGRKAACAACHRVGREGGPVGPDLTKVGAVRSGEDLLESILFPSSTIAQGYEQYAVTTADGRTVGGVIARQSADTLVLRDSSGAEVRLRNDQVKGLERRSTSLMPDGLERAVTPDELRDLLAFLKSLR